MGISESPFDDVEARQSAWFRPAEGHWAAWLVGALAAAALLFVLLLHLPDASLPGNASALCTASDRLGWAALAAPADKMALARARSNVDHAWSLLAAAAARNSIVAPELTEFARRWAMLPAAPSAEALQALAADADRLALALRDEVESRQLSTERALKGVTLVLALTLLLPIHGLWRKHQRLRSSLHDFSDQLGSGDWHGAVRRLRDDRLGAPSAFDALATGVEGLFGESDRRWRALADLSADWYWETDLEHRFSWLSRSSQQRKSWLPDDLVGRRRDEVEHFAPPAGGWEEFHRSLDRHDPLREVEFRIHRPGHRAPSWVSISGRPRFDRDGTFLGYEGVGHDITERKTAHERLASSEQRWSLMAGLASDWYWQTDDEHRILPLAPEFQRRFPGAGEHLVGLTRWEAHHDGLPPESWAEHRADLDARRPFRGLQFEAEVSNGRWLWLSISGIPRFDADGRFAGYHGVGRDITVRKHAERVLLRHNEELQRAVGARTRELEQLNRDLDAFSRQLAHELRTPISHVEGLANLLVARAGGRLNDDERQLVDLQRQAARSMRSTVDALMLLARSTVQAMAMEDVDVSAIAAAAAAELPEVERRGPVGWSIDPGLRAQAAPAALRIVFVNLLGNAAKFTRHVDDAQVRVSGRADTDGRLRICVEDNGAGFDPALASRLFVPFSRLHSSEQFHGTGIGLSIVQRIVERHGGSVAARAEPERGACFEFTLAAAEADPAPVSAPPAVTTAG